MSWQTASIKRADCNTCFAEPADLRRRDGQCTECGEYLDWWNSLTPEQQQAEHDAVEEHCRIQHEMGYDKE